ncbi:hypothetical protein ABIB62_001877 [Mucilaginibacter sp. UYP25]|uniref:hypothetical protein n=1 Tax=unclassified Mucilaginibacter TaxID=2617802 RepID=UPI00339AA93E
MKTFNLHNGLQLNIQLDNKKLRLVITDGIAELACRKETASNLNRFLSSAQNNLFSGRLQLHKSEDNITVLLKGKPAGSVSVSELKNVLNN